jgi:hypothetical protein
MSEKKFPISRILWAAPIVLVALLAFAIFQRNRMGRMAGQSETPLMSSPESRDEITVEIFESVPLSDRPQADQSTPIPTELS